FIAQKAAPAVAANDSAEALDAVRAASVHEDVASAVIRLPDGTLFARFDREPATPRSAFDVDTTTAVATLPWRLLTVDALRVTRPVEQGGRLIATVSIDSRADAARSRAKAFLGIILLVLFGTFWMALILSMRLQRLISRPIQALTSTTLDVTH